MAKGEHIRLLVVASGATEWDDAGRVQGATDLPLAPCGRDAILRDAESLKADHLSQILSAPDEASLEASKILAQATNAKVKPVSGLSEMSLGLWEGLLACDLEDRYQRAARQWNEDPASVNVPESEPFADAHERVCITLLRTLEKVKSGSAVATVLRPLSLGMVRCWLNEEPSSSLHKLLRDRPSSEWYEVSVGRLRDLPIPAPTR